MKKIFISNKRSSAITKECKERFEELSLESLEIKCNSKPLSKIPRDYDLYFIHFADLENIDDADNLREEQPWSKIYFLKGGGDNAKNIRDFLMPKCNGCYSSIFNVDYLNMLNKSGIKTKEITKITI